MGAMDAGTQAGTAAGHPHQPGGCEPSRTPIGMPKTPCHVFVGGACNKGDPCEWTHPEGKALANAKADLEARQVAVPTAEHVQSRGRSPAHHTDAHQRGNGRSRAVSKASRNSKDSTNSEKSSLHSDGGRGRGGQENNINDRARSNGRSTTPAGPMWCGAYLAGSCRDGERCGEVCPHPHLGLATQEAIGGKQGQHCCPQWREDDERDRHGGRNWQDGEHVISCLGRPSSAQALVAPAPAAPVISRLATT